MSENIDLEAEIFKREDMRDIVADKVKWIRKEFRLIPLKFENFNHRVAEELQTRWDEENKNYISNLKKTEKPLDRLQRWKDMSKNYRSEGLSMLADAWYATFWKLRSEISLVVALYEFSEIQEISQRKAELKKSIKEEFQPVVMRMRGPRKPTKKKILLRDLEYSVGEAFSQMVNPLEKLVIETQKLCDSLVAPKKKLSIAVKKKRYLNAYTAREKLTIITQAVAPRQDSSSNNENDS